MTMPLCFVTLLCSGFAFLFGEDLIDYVLAQGRYVNREFSDGADLFAKKKIAQTKRGRDGTFIFKAIIPGWVHRVAKLQYSGPDLHCSWWYTVVVILCAVSPGVIQY